MTDDKTTYTTFDTGYRVIDKSDGHGDFFLNSDKAVDELFNEWVKIKDTNSISWDYMRKLILTANRLIPNLAMFIYIQKNNKYLSDKDYNYLNDILKFVLEGKQDMHPLIAIKIMDGYNYDYKINVSNRSIKVPKELMSTTGPDYISMWLSKPYGLENMVYNLKVLFGERLKEDHYTYTWKVGKDGSLYGQ